MLNKYFDTLLKKLLFTTCVLFTAIIAIQLFSFSMEKEVKNDVSYQKYFNTNYKIFSLNLPSKLSFADEPVPMDMLDIRERLDRELLVNTYWQSQTLLFHKRASRWFPVIEPILKKNGIPDDFKYLALIESGLVNVVSPAGATGYWQLMKETAIQYGLEVNAEVDERYHVEKSTEAACKYLNEAYKRYGNWSLAAASYNMGMNGLERQMKRQKVDNYYDLLLNDETARYLFRILAAKEMISKPSLYGFHFRKKDLYPPYEVQKIKLDSAVTDFAAFALENGVNYKILKLFNPWLRDSYLTNPNKKVYEISLPNPGSLLVVDLESPEDFLPDSLRGDSL